MTLLYTFRRRSEIHCLRYITEALTYRTGSHFWSGTGCVKI